MSRVEGRLYCQEALVCPRHDTSNLHVDAEIGGRILDLVIQDRENAFVRHFERVAKQHWTERNDTNLNEEI